LGLEGAGTQGITLNGDVSKAAKPLSFSNGAIEKTVRNRF
jgi:hypothetical protein